MTKFKKHIRRFMIGLFLAMAIASYYYGGIKSLSISLACWIGGYFLGRFTDWLTEKWLDHKYRCDVAGCPNRSAMTFGIRKAGTKGDWIRMKLCVEHEEEESRALREEFKVTKLKTDFKWKG